MTPKNLIHHYELLFVTHGPTAISAKMGLFCVLLLVLQGNKNPGHRLLAAVFGVHFLVAAFISGFSTPGTIVLMVTSLVLCALCLKQAATTGFQWQVLPAEDPGRTMAIAGFATAFLFPIWPGIGLARGLIYAPMAILPQLSLMALLVLMATNRGGWSKAATVTVLAVTAILAVTDLAVGNRLLGLVLLVYGGFAAALCLDLVPARTAGTENEPAKPSPGPDRPAAAVAAKAVVKPKTTAPDKPAPPQEPKSPSRKWDIR